jgi:prephenate dehydrogenase
MNKTIGIIGLGLIGGSLAKALKANTAHTVYGLDICGDIMGSALAQGAIDAALDEKLFAECDMILLALYPREAIDFAKKNIDNFKKGAVIIDCGGVKGNICAALSEFASKKDRYFIGGHPMAGIEKSGFGNSFAHLFDGATMILCKDEFTNIIALKAAEMLFSDIGFTKVTITTAEEHDKIIAFTSQLAHIVSNAYIKSETAKNQLGFSAGSYKDLTRVAWLDENMWTELFFENKKHLVVEIESLCQRLSKYVEVLQENDAPKMKQLLLEGKKAKEAIG